MCAVRAGVGVGDVPHPGAGIPDQQGVRALLQVHEQHQDRRLLRRNAGAEGRADAARQLSAHRGRNARSAGGFDPIQAPQPQARQTLCARRVRQDAGPAW